MMPKGKNALNLLFYFLLSSGLMMAAAPRMSPGTDAFNDSLKGWTGKSTPPSADDLKKVVIDAGHGGKDPGGMGANSREKNIALRIAQLLAIGIRTNYPDVEVIMTRSDDTFIPLYERADIANKAGADLFISIHANIMPGSSATFGTETFVMGQHVAEQNLRVAKRENAAVLLESGDVTANYGYDPNSPEGHILMSLQQHAFLERSIQFAEAVERQFAVSGRKSRGVKQAGFVVLKATTMPAVLVETGFMSNPDEEAYLLSEAGQQQLANALLLAFGEYHQSVTRKAAPVALACPAPTGYAGGALLPRPPAPAANKAVNTTTLKAVQPSAPAPATVSTVSIFSKEVDLNEARSRQWSARGASSAPALSSGGPRVTPLPASVPQTTRTVAPVTYQPQNLPARTEVLRKEVISGPSPRNVVPAPPRPAYTSYDYPKVVPDSTLPGGYRFTEARQRRKPLPPGTVDLRAIPDNQLLYAVQIFATKRDLDLRQSPWNKVPYPIVKLREGNLNKYQVRNLATAASAKTARDRIKASGIKESLVVIYLNGKRLPMSAVNYLLAR